MKHRMCRVLLCLVLTFALLLPMTVGALADTTIGTDASRPEYFEALGGSGSYNPLKTPYHYDKTTGNVAYCLEHKKDSPSSSAAYTDFDPSALWGHNTVTGIQATVDHGYPNSTGGLTEEQAHYATANAIRAWMKESADVGYNFMRVDEGHIRPLSGTAAQETWVFFLELLGYARAGATLGGTSGGMELHADHLMLGDQYARVLFCQTYPSFLLDRTVRELASLPANLVLSIDLIPVSTDEAVGRRRRSCSARRPTSPTGSANRTRTTTSPPWCPTTWRSSATRCARCSATCAPATSGCCSRWSRWCTSRTARRSWTATPTAYRRWAVNAPASSPHCGISSWKG